MLTRITTLALIAIVAAACNPSSAGRGEPASVVGREFLSTEVTENGTARPLVEGSRIRMAFERVRFSMNAGCNSFSGGYTITAGQLIVDQMASTEMACPQPLMDQDQWLAQFLAKKPLIPIAGNHLSLEADGTVIRFLDREVAEPDLPLVGTNWSLVSVISSDAITSYNVDPAPTIVFAADGTVTLTTGCNSGSATYTATGGTLKLPPIATTKMACAGDRMTLEAQVLEVLSAESIRYTMDASTLELKAGDNGLQYAGTPAAN